MEEEDVGVMVDEVEIILEDDFVTTGLQTPIGMAEFMESTSQMLTIIFLLINGLDYNKMAKSLNSRTPHWNNAGRGVSGRGNAGGRSYNSSHDNNNHSQFC